MPDGEVGIPNKKIFDDFNAKFALLFSIVFYKVNMYWHV